MFRTSSILVALLVLAQVRLWSQEVAAADSSTPPAPATTTPPSLAPVPDAPAGATPSALTAPAAAPAPAPAPTTTTTTTTATTKTTTTTSAPSRADIARIQQQEIIRRQEGIFRANQAMSTAHKAELGNDYPEARKNYLFAAEEFGTVSRTTTSYTRAAEGLARVDFVLYDAALKIGDTARAKLLIDEIVQYNPNNKVATDKQAAVNKMLANPNDTSLLGNPAVTPGFVSKVNEVQQLFAEAEQYRRTGQWDLAEAKLKRILGIDPYNIAATKQLDLIASQKEDYFDKQRIETRDERLRQVEEKWYQPINNKDVTTGAQDSQPVLTRATNFDLEQKLKALTISLDFSNATIEDATSYLSSQSKQLDTPDHKGVNFIIQPEASSSAKPITLTLNNVPMDEALRYVCQLANVKYKVQDYAVSIVPFTQSTDDLIRRTFKVNSDFVTPPAASGTIVAASASAFSARPLPTPGGAATPADTGDEDTARQALEARGVVFPPGATAVYSRASGELTIFNTADQMELIEELVTAGQAPTLMVKISAKFVEINQNDLNDLTVNSAFNLFDPLTQGATSHLLTPSFNTSLSGSREFSPNSIAQLINPTTQNFNSLYVRSFLDAAQYNVVVDALSQKSSFDDLSDPFATTKSGGKADLEAVRIFPYPSSFDPPELLTQTNNNNATTLVAIVSPPVVIASTPNEFHTKRVGVRLVTNPQVQGDDKNISLQLSPEVTDFEGFINYGSPIYVGNPDGTQSLLSTNKIVQPVFNTRNVVTSIVIQDGSTVVLGGLIRDDVQTVNDKVPLLGDLPFIGRLFQSKATQNTKRNLIIFVTANIYRNDGELLNPPEEADAAGILTGHTTYSTVASP